MITKLRVCLKARMRHLRSPPNRMRRCLDLALPSRTLRFELGPLEIPEGATVLVLGASYYVRSLAPPSPLRTVIVFGLDCAPVQDCTPARCMVGSTSPSLLLLSPSPTHSVAFA